MPEADRPAPLDEPDSSGAPLRAQLMQAKVLRLLALASAAFLLVIAPLSSLPWLATALSLLLAQCMPRVEAVLTATMLSWAVYAIAAGWAFYARTAWGAWGGTLLPAMVLGACATAPQWMRTAA